MFSAHNAVTNYRPDIDGLRGIAVLMVLAYHFHIPPVTGGYIGVDIFFVISGYLITSLLRNERGITKPLLTFYNRRIKRLLPMFLVFALITTIAATVILLPDDFINYLKSLRSALSFQSNEYFDVQTKDYFAPNARELPLLHTWSLSIEWQFYLSFPLIYLFLQARISQQARKAGLMLAATGFALWSIFLTQDSSNAYFLTSPRFFELLVGACATEFKLRRANMFSVTLTVTCVIVLCCLAIVFTPSTNFPGINAVLVCLLTVLVILYGQDNRLLSSRWLVHVGQISYSAYLWHWPFVAIAQYLQIPLPPHVGVALLILVLLISHYSHAWVEQPFRRSGMTFRASFSAMLLLPLISVIAALEIAKLNNGFPQRLGAESTYVYNLIRPYLRNNQGHCHDFKWGNIEDCSFGDLQANAKALLFGDSHARHYWWFVNTLAHQAHIKVTGLSYGSCLMLPGVTRMHHNHEATVDSQTQCRDATTRITKMIRDGGYKYVLIAHHWIGYPRDEYQYLDATIANIIASGATPIIFGPVAEDGADKKECFYSHIKFRSSYHGECNIKRPNPFASAKRAEVDQMFKHIVAKFPSVIFVDTMMVQCKEDQCAASIEGAPIYSDDQHINGYGSATLARRYIEHLGNPFLAGHKQNVAETMLR